MKLVFAPDSLKGSLAAYDAARAMQRAAARVFPDAQCVLSPVADGGEGTVEALTAGRGCVRTVRVKDPLGRAVDAVYGVLDGGQTAVIEMAQASGLPLTGGKDVLSASSFGTGELIAHALRAGARVLLIGLGGSATNDGGMGMLTALGARFCDGAGAALVGSAGELARVRTCDLSNLMKELSGARVEVMCDVDNPLLGENGATAIYGPQKGVTAALFEEVEAGMRNYAQVLHSACGRPLHFPGAGAAGGMGAALGGTLGAAMRPGIEAVLDAVRFDALLEGCALVVTGEGRIDRQSVAFGKAPTGVARRCARAGVPVIALVGGMGPGACDYFGVAEASIETSVNAPMTVAQAMEGAEALYEEAAERMLRTVRIGMHMAAQTLGKK